MSQASSSSVDAGLVRAAANRKLVRRLALGVLASFAFGFALVPFYDALCRLTGFNGKDFQGKQPVPAMVLDASRLVRVEFTGTIMPGLNWELKPEAEHLRIHPGQLIQTSFLVKNLSNRPLTGQAVPSISPGQASRHFQKIECFCFSQQTLQPGEEKRMPLTFVVNPELDRDVATITLSYAFFDASRR